MEVPAFSSGAGEKTAESFPDLKANFSAFEKAKEAVQKPLEKLMEDFQEGMEKEYLIAKISGVVTAFPTLVCREQRSSVQIRKAPQPISGCL